MFDILHLKGTLVILLQRNLMKTSKLKDGAIFPDVRSGLMRGRAWNVNEGRVRPTNLGPFHPIVQLPWPRPPIYIWSVCVKPAMNTYPLHLSESEWSAEWLQHVKPSPILVYVILV